jgi:pyruvate/2-oxoglutarate dehydrogenase complex dihydrolipoamide acyltransferase (E2) component
MQIFKTIWTGERLSPRRRLLYSMWRPPTDGRTFGVQTVDVTSLLECIKKRNDASSGPKITITHALSKGIGTIALDEKYDLNGHFFMGRFLRHRTKDVGVLVTARDGKDLGAVKISSIDRKTLKEISAEVKAYAEAFRRQEENTDHKKASNVLSSLPFFMIRAVVDVVGFLNNRLGIPTKGYPSQEFPMGRLIISSLMTYGVDIAFPPLVASMHMPAAVVISAVHSKVVVFEGKPAVRKVVNLCWTFDHRFSDGVDLAKIAIEVRNLFENPEALFL